MSSATAFPATGSLKDGDIVNIDVTPILDGWHGDTSRMFLVGDVPLKARRLVDVTYECLMLGHRAGAARQSSRRHRPRHPDLCRGASLRGGARFLRPRPRPGVPRRARGRPCRPARHRARSSKPGMFFTIEPMINIGKAACKVLDDGWTAVTRDRSLSAQFEHSIGITETAARSSPRARRGSTSRLTPELSRSGPLGTRRQRLNRPRRPAPGDRARTRRGRRCPSEVRVDRYRSCCTGVDAAQPAVERSRLTMRVPSVQSIRAPDRGRFT